MFSKEQFLDSVRQETAIAKHIAGKLSAEQLDFRPGENIRSNLELMRYLTYCGIVPARGVLADDWSQAQSAAAEAADMEAGAFVERMDAQLAAIEEAVESLSQSDLENRDVQLPWGVTDKLGAVLVNTSLKFLTAYRMQLYVQAKASGLNELNTMNCWMGTDPPAAG